MQFNVVSVVGMCCNQFLLDLALSLSLSLNVFAIHDALGGSGDRGAVL